MKPLLSILFWMSLLPGFAGVWGDLTPIARDFPPTPSVSEGTSDLCISPGQPHTLRSSIDPHESAFEEEESSDSEDLSGSACLAVEIRNPSRFSSQATLRHWDANRIAPRSDILRC